MDNFTICKCSAKNAQIKGQIKVAFHVYFWILSKFFLTPPSKNAPKHSKIAIFEILIFHPPNFRVPKRVTQKIVLPNLSA